MERDLRWSQIVVFHLVRHDTLAPTVSVRSVLPGLANLASRVGEAVDATPGRLAAVWHRAAGLVTRAARRAPAASASRGEGVLR